MSPPHENVLLVPFRNVVLTGSVWEGARTKSSDHDPAGSRPAGGAEESWAPPAALFLPETATRGDAGAAQSVKVGVFTQTLRRQPNYIFTLSTVIVSPSIFPLTVNFFP